MPRNHSCLLIPSDSACSPRADTSTTAVRLHGSATLRPAPIWTCVVSVPLTSSPAIDHSTGPPNARARRYGLHRFANVRPPIAPMRRSVATKLVESAPGARLGATATLSDADAVTNHAPPPGVHR